jgi:hypothetical protein
MSFLERFVSKAGKEVELLQPNTDEGEQLDPVLEAALRDFRRSVHAWSDAVYNRPRAASSPVHRRVWRLALGWTLGCFLVIGGFSGGLFEHHRRVVRIEAARVAEQQRLAAEQRDRLAREAEEEDLLAKVDSDVSREVPSAMEPLAQLMADDETK